MLIALRPPSLSRAVLRACFALSCLAGVEGAANAALREQVQSLKPLLVAAVQQGEAHGVLVGPAADAIANQFASREPIEVDVKVIGNLPSPGCKRLQVDTRQAKVADRERAAIPGEQGKALPPKPMLLRYSISFCADGTFPPPAARATTSTNAGVSTTRVTPADGGTR